MEDEEPHCLICLGPIRDKAVLPNCLHAQTCFECIMKWTDVHRRCPLCNSPVGPFIIHHFRSETQYSRHYLRPLPDPAFANKPGPSLIDISSGVRRQLAERPSHPRHRYGARRERQLREQMQTEEERTEASLRKRDRIYSYGLYAKHIASNTSTRFRPYPPPSQFDTNAELIRRSTVWIRRELWALNRSFHNLDVEFLTSYVVGLMKSLDIKSEGAIGLMAEWLGYETAQHLAHETESFIRSPYKTIEGYDRVVQYEEPGTTYNTQRKRRRCSFSPEPGPSRSSRNCARPSLSPKRSEGADEPKFFRDESSRASAPRSDGSPTESLRFRRAAAADDNEPRSLRGAGPSTSRDMSDSAEPASRSRSPRDSARSQTLSRKGKERAVDVIDLTSEDANRSSANVNGASVRLGRGRYCLDGSRKGDDKADRPAGNDIETRTTELPRLSEQPVCDESTMTPPETGSGKSTPSLLRERLLAKLEAEKRRLLERGGQSEGSEAGEDLRAIPEKTEPAPRRDVQALRARLLEKLEKEKGREEWGICKRASEQGGKSEEEETAEKDREEALQTLAREQRLKHILGRRRSTHEGNQ